MTPLTLAEIRATINDATPDMTAALLRDLEWMIRDGFDVRPAEGLEFSEGLADVRAMTCPHGIDYTDSETIACLREHGYARPPEGLDDECSGYYRRGWEAGRVAAPAEGLRFDDGPIMEWGIVIDALVEHAASARARKETNSASTSDFRAEACERMIQAIAADAGAAYFRRRAALEGADRD